MAYFYCRTRFQIQTQTWQDFPIGSELDFDPLIEMYVIGTEICHLGKKYFPKMGTVTIWERDPNLSPGQWKDVLHNTMYR